MKRIHRVVAGGILAMACLAPLEATAVGLPDTPTTPTVPDKPDPPVTPEPPVMPEPPDIPVKDKPDGPPEEPKEKPKKTKKVPKVPVPVKPFTPEVNVYPVPSKKNYCPAGLVPVTISGSISCGTPTTTTTYQQMMKHPQPVQRVHKKKHVTTYRRSARPTCEIGTKGCTDR